ncbi:hypothetical protein [Parahaliea mediterranea]|uniref:hypothetical protein n=1 Tax=Parahaliea mediterranea TaxID=651086 RepID=UPI0018821470|nr:hypothetical protein [Parahaliea mediterranea]
MNTQVAVQNPFGGQAPSVGSHDTLASAEEQRAIQEVQAAMVIAKKFPRNMIEAMDRILNSCTRESLAETAIYSYPRGGQEVTGPSIRLAEALAQEWGNMQFGIRELSQENGASTVEAFAWDVQTNTRQVKTFRVPHTRYTRKGTTQLSDPRDIYELIANQGARRLRACILGVIPGDVVEAAVNQCKVTQEASVEVTPETIKKMLAAFKDNYGVPQELIEKRIGRRAEALNPPQYLMLKRVYQSLKDGMGKPSDYFDMDDPAALAGPATSDLNEQVKKQPAKQAAKPKPDPEPPTEEEELPAAATSDFDDIMLKLKEARSLEELDGIREAAMEFITDLPKEQQEQLTGLHSKRKEELEQ